MSKLAFYLEKDLLKCKKIWHLFSPNFHFFDDWDFRLLFHSTYQSDPYFIVGTLGDEPIGCIPLEYNRQEKMYHYFGDGGGWIEQNQFFFKNNQIKQKYLGYFLRKFPINTEILFIKDNDPKTVTNFTIDEDLGYYIYPGEFNYNFALYKNSFSRSGRKNLRRSIRDIEKINYSVLFDIEKDLKRIFKWSEEKFGEKSALNDKLLEKSFLNFFKS